MSEHVYRVTEIVGTSSDSVEAAIRNGIGRASQTLRGLDWFEVVEIRGAIGDGDVSSFQISMKVGFRLDDGA
jgi:dodecin